MSLLLTAQQLAYFRDRGQIPFTNLLTQRKELENALKNRKEARDLWREEPLLKKCILRQLAPIALELTGKRALRLACDQWLPTSKGDQPFHFCFQPLACIVAIPFPEGEITFLEPSSLHLCQNSYLVVFAHQHAVYIKKETDSSYLMLKKMGYAFGDPLKAPLHPLIYA